MKRAILVSAGTIAGLAAVLSYSGVDASVASADTSGTGGAGAGLGGPAPIPSGAPAPSDSAAAPTASASTPGAAATSAAPTTKATASAKPSAKPTGSAAPSPSKSTTAPKPTPSPTKTTAKPTPSPTKTAAPKPSPTPAAFKDFLGSVVPDASYGNMQVGIRVQNGKIIDAWAAQYPNTDPTSTRLNTRAIPILRTETIGTTTSKIATVAGATLSSNAWIASLQAAMTAAGL